MYMCMLFVCMNVFNFSSFLNYFEQFLFVCTMDVKKFMCILLIYMNRPSFKLSSSIFSNSFFINLCKCMQLLSLNVHVYCIVCMYITLMYTYMYMCMLFVCMNVFHFIFELFWSIRTYLYYWCLQVYVYFVDIYEQ